MIRCEQPDDASRIRDVTARAFSESEFGHHGEADLVERLRGSCDDFVSLVAEEAGEVVGHVLFTPVVIEGEGRSVSGMGLGPLSVLPQWQRQGIGTRLVEEGLRTLGCRDCLFVVVLGDPEYYVRFGFLPAEEFGVRSEFPGIPDGAFRVAVIASADGDVPAGIAKYRPEFSQLA